MSARAASAQQLPYVEPPLSLDPQQPLYELRDGGHQDHHQHLQLARRSGSGSIQQLSLMQPYQHQQPKQLLQQQQQQFTPQHQHQQGYAGGAERPVSMTSLPWPADNVGLAGPGGGLGAGGMQGALSRLPPSQQLQHQQVGPGGFELEAHFSGLSTLDAPGARHGQALPGHLGQSLQQQFQGPAGSALQRLSLPGQRQTASFGSGNNGGGGPAAAARMLQTYQAASGSTGAGGAAGGGGGGTVHEDMRIASSSTRSLFKVCETRAYHDEIDLLLGDLDDQATAVTAAAAAAAASNGGGARWAGGSGSIAGGGGGGVRASSAAGFGGGSLDPAGGMSGLGFEAVPGAYSELDPPLMGGPSKMSRRESDNGMRRYYSSPLPVLDPALAAGRGSNSGAVAGGGGVNGAPTASAGRMGGGGLLDTVQMLAAQQQQQRQMQQQQQQQGSMYGPAAGQGLQTGFDQSCGKPTNAFSQHQHQQSHPSMQLLQQQQQQPQLLMGQGPVPTEAQSAPLYRISQVAPPPGTQQWNPQQAQHHNHQHPHLRHAHHQLSSHSESLTLEPQHGSATVRGQVTQMQHQAYPQQPRQQQMQMQQPPNLHSPLMQAQHQPHQQMQPPLQNNMQLLPQYQQHQQQQQQQQQQASEHAQRLHLPTPGASSVPVAADALDPDLDLADNELLYGLLDEQLDAADELMRDLLADAHQEDDGHHGRGRPPNLAPQAKAQQQQQQQQQQQEQQQQQGQVLHQGQQQQPLQQPLQPLHQRDGTAVPMAMAGGPRPPSNAAAGGGMAGPAPVVLLPMAPGPAPTPVFAPAAGAGAGFISNSATASAANSSGMPPPRSPADPRRHGSTSSLAMGGPSSASMLPQLLPVGALPPPQLHLQQQYGNGVHGGGNGGRAVGSGSLPIYTLGVGPSGGGYVHPQLLGGGAGDGSCTGSGNYSAAAGAGTVFGAIPAAGGPSSSGWLGPGVAALGAAPGAAAASSRPGTGTIAANGSRPPTGSIPSATPSPGLSSMGPHGSGAAEVGPSSGGAGSVSAAGWGPEWSTAACSHEAAGGMAGGGDEDGVDQAAAGGGRNSSSGPARALAALALGPGGGAGGSTDGAGRALAGRAAEDAGAGLSRGGLKASASAASLRDSPKSAGPARSGGVVGKDGKRVYNRTVPTFGDIISHGLFPPGPCRWTVGTIKEEVSVEVRPSGEILYCGNAYPSISAFALVVLRSRNSERIACDGWREVRHNGIKMEVLRKECLRMMLENGEL
eukprot:XP_001697445.1 predicted protein [Chlamydomonas reinhardtii]